MCDAFKVIDVSFGSKDLFGQPSNEPVVKRTTGPIWWYRDFYYCLYSNKMRSLLKIKIKKEEDKWLSYSSQCTLFSKSFRFYIKD